MHYDGDDFLSIHDFVAIMCNCDKKESESSILNEFCTIMTSKYSFEELRCFRAQADDKTRHILFPTYLILDIFMNENIRRFLILDSFIEKLKKISQNNYFISNLICCCCPKKLKKSISAASSFTEFVKKGDAEMRRFNSLRHSIKYVVSLDIEGKSTVNYFIITF